MGTNYLEMLKRTSKLPVYTDLDTLDMYCEYLLNDDNRAINYSNLTNLKDYVDTMDPKVFYSSDPKTARYYFISLYLEARLNNGLVSRKLCLRYVDDNIDSKYKQIIHREILGSIEPGQLKKKDIEFINDMVFAQLNVMFLHKYKIAMTRMIEDLNTNNFGKTSTDCDNAIQFFQAILSDLTKAQRRSKQDNRFNLTDITHFNATLQEAWERILSDSNYLQTGWQGMNKMLGGGFENARVYNFIGATGGFKSGLLLNIMKSIKLYNKGKKFKDPIKRPTVLFISQENNIWETLHRIFGIFGTVENIKKFKPDEIMELLAKGGFTVVQDDEDIDIEFRYYGNADISVPDLKGIYEELDNSGREVICIIQDYIERLRPPMLNVERRTQLFDISNQLHDLAMELDIPIITGSQFNRDGVATIEEMRSQNKVDIGKNVGSKNTSESFGMLKNFDVNIGIVIEYDSSEDRFYLSFNKFKFRGDEADTLSYFLQPFVGKQSKIQLMDDINSDYPVFRLSLADELAAHLVDDAKNLDKITRKTKNFLEPIVDIDEIDTQEFIDNLQERVRKSKADQGPDPIRDEQGFIILIPRLGMKTHLV